MDNRLECSITVHEESDSENFQLEEDMLLQSFTGSLSRANISASQLIASGNYCTACSNVFHHHLNLHAQIERGFCNPEATVTRYGMYSWPETMVGTTVQMECEFGSSISGQRLSRECLEINRWMDGINPGMCFSQVTLNIQSIGVSVNPL